MTDDINDPKVIAYRLKTLEAKVDSVTAKLDSLSFLVTKNLCPNPGACVAMTDTIVRLEAIVRQHENDIQEVKLAMARAAASFRTIGVIAGGAGSALGFAISALVSWLTK